MEELIHIESTEETYQEHPFIPNRKLNYLPNQIIISSTKFTRVEQKLFEMFVNQINYAMIKANHSLIVRIPIVEVKKFVRASQILEVTHSMASKVMTLFDMNNPQHRFAHIPIFTLVAYNQDNSGFLEFRTNSLFTPYLASLGSEYTKYDYKTIMGFKSIYTSLMYKLVRMQLGQRKTNFTYSVIGLKAFLQVDKKYDDLKDLKKNVLAPAIKELAEMPIPIEIEITNTGGKIRNVTHFDFKITTTLDISRKEKEDFKFAVTQNPEAVFAQIEHIIRSEYTFSKAQQQHIIDTQELLNIFINLHLEIISGIHPQIRNKTKWMLACLGLINTKVNSPAKD
jgi:plasmid replication initiation protein